MLNKYLVVLSASLVVISLFKSLKAELINVNIKSNIVSISQDSIIFKNKFGLYQAQKSDFDKDSIQKESFIVKGSVRDLLLISKDSTTTNNIINEFNLTKAQYDIATDELKYPSLVLLMSLSIALLMTSYISILVS